MVQPVGLQRVRHDLVTERHSNMHLLVVLFLQGALTELAETSRGFRPSCVREQQSQATGQGPVKSELSFSVPL